MKKNKTANISDCKEDKQEYILWNGMIMLSDIADHD
jgi:hypothetical protein